MLENCSCGSDDSIKKEKLIKLIDENKSDKGNLMRVLNETQEIYGFLPMFAQKMISDGMGIPMAEIYGVVTFYSRFSLKPKGKYNIAVCLGTACYVKGSQDILDKLKEILQIDVGEVTADGKFSIEATRCLGACSLAPVITINGEVHGKLDPSMIKELIEKCE